MTPRLHIQLLGRFRLTADNASSLTLDSPRLQALLAYLLLQRDAPHARAHLAFQLWPDTTEAQAHANLRTLLHRLRQALPEANRFLQVDAQTVRWRGDAPATLDVADFERALAQAAAAEQGGDQGAAQAAFRDAVEQYGGDLLPALYDDWVLVERERLRQTFLAGLEKLVVLLERANEYAAAIGYAQRLLRHDPLHEAAYQHLMRLHALSGDRASAVRVYRTCATVLERELGVEPSLATREAHAQLLRAAVPLRAPVDHPSAPAPGAQRHNLPIALTSFIGRTHELAEVRRLLAMTRLLTLTGVGGCGKTRLALAAATTVLPEYSDGVWLVELGALADAALVPQAAAAALGVREEPQRALTTTLVDALRPMTLLLVLDNCEHLLDSCAHLAETLLSACPRLRILATSRETLGLAGETTWLVPSLSLPQPQQLPRLVELIQSEAVQLFVERAAAALPTFTLTPENASDVVQICQRLDGIPLAIELAAARVKLLPVAQITTRLDACFRLLTGGGRTAVPRQQSLRAALDQSLALFLAIGDKQGAATVLERLAWVARSQDDYLAARELSEQSLAFARESRDTHAIAQSLDNLGYTTLHSDPEQAQQFFEQSLALFQTLGDKQEISAALNGLGIVALMTGSYGDAETRFAAALELRRAIGDRRGCVMVLANLGNVALLQDDSTRGRMYYQDSFARARALDYPEGICLGLEGLAGAAALAGEAERAAKLLGTAEVLHESIGFVPDPDAQLSLDRTVQLTRAQLSDEALAAAWEEGRAMPLEQAIAAALDGVDPSRVPPKLQKEA